MATTSSSAKHIPHDSESSRHQAGSSTLHGLITPTVLPPTIPVTPLDINQLHKAIEKYAPILNLHPDEQFVNTSIEDFLQHSTLVDKQTNARTKAPTPDSLPQHGADSQYYLEVDTAGKPGRFETAKAYVRAFWQPGMPHTDLQFWFFNAYNGPGTAHISGLVMDAVSHSGDVDLAPMGEHWGDWEMCMVRIENTTVKISGIWLSQHAKGEFLFSTGHQLEQSISFQGTQPVIYSARNGHGNFPSPGPNPTENHKFGGIPAGVDFFIRNDCATGGLQLDCAKKYELVSADWLNVPTPKWLTYPFRWGPEGTSIHLNAKSVVDIVRDAAGKELEDFLPVSVLTVLAGDILSHFVKSDINGPASPSQHGSWNGTYPVYT